MIGNVLGISWRRSSLVSLSDDSALVIDNQKSANALVVTNSIDSLFEISHFKFLLLQLIKLTTNFTNQANK